MQPKLCLQKAKVLSGIYLNTLKCDVGSIKLESKSFRLYRIRD